MGHKRLGNLEKRQKKADENMAICKVLTIPQRIAKLDAKLGKGMGAKRERARLAKAALNDIPKAQEKVSQEKAPKKYARKYSGKDKSDTK